MKVTFPHMGNLAVSARTLLNGMGLEVIVPPPCTKKTLSLGAKFSPECACLPLKVNIGNYIEAAELGAEAIVMAGGVGPCRIGYYAEVQREILWDLGYKMEMVVLEPPDARFSELTTKIRYLCRNPWSKVLKGLVLAWQKTCALDRLEQRVQWIRPRENQIGSGDRIFMEALGKIDQARNGYEVESALSEGFIRLEGIPLDKNRKVLKIALVGEIYTVLEPFVNHNIERHLGRLGVEVIRFISLSQWINDHLLGGIFPGISSKKLKKMANPYLNHFVGGHGRETVGAAVASAINGFDGLIQLAPLTCMPEIVAHTVLPRISKDYELPQMTIYLDEQSGEAGLLTRLEAFIDMVALRRNSKPM